MPECSSTHVQSPEIFQGSHLQDASHSINFDDYLTQESDQLIFGPPDLEDVDKFSSPSFQWDSFPDIDFAAWINDSNIDTHSPSSPIPIPSPTDTTSSFIGYQDHTQFSPNERAFSPVTFAAFHPLPRSISPPSFEETKNSLGHVTRWHTTPAWASQLWDAPSPLRT